MPRLKQFCTCLLLAVLLIPAISHLDDAISLASFPRDAGTQDDALIAVHNLGKFEFDSSLATLLDSLDNTIQAGDACILFVNLTSAPLFSVEQNRNCNLNIAASVGRAPPV